MPTVASAAASHHPSRQRAALDRLHRETQAPIRAAFRQAFAGTSGGVQPAMARFTRAYGAEQVRVNAVNADDEDNEATARVSLVWLHTSGHLDALRAPFVSALHHAAQTSLTATLTGQRQAFASAQTYFTAIPPNAWDTQQSGDDTDSQQRRQDDGGIVIPTVPTGRYGASGYNGQPIANYFTQIPANAWDTVLKTVNAGIASGESPDQLLSALEGIVGSMASYALLVAESEITSAFRWMLSALFGANPNAVSGWIWRAQPDACDECAGQDGTLHGVDEEMDSHPRCRCTMQPVNAAGQAINSDW